LAILVVVFAGAILNEVNLLLILSGMLLGPLLLNWRAVGVNLQGLRLERKLPQGLCAGDTVTIGLSLKNTRRRGDAWAVVVEEQVRLEAADPGDSRRRKPPLRFDVLFSHVPAGDLRKSTCSGRLVQRGRYLFGPSRLSTRFPFGLFSRSIEAGETDALLVLPRLGRLTEGWTARRVEVFSGADRHRRQAGPVDDFYGVRDWRAGDGRRLVHWRSSARLGKLVVRQFERPSNRDVAVVLDLRRPEVSDEAACESVELAVSFAATVLADACRKGGCNVHLAYYNAKPECVGGAASSSLLQGLMEQLAVVEAVSDDVLPDLLMHALRQIDSGAEIVLVSTRPVDPTDPKQFAPLWSHSLLRDRARHIRCIDASSESLSHFFLAE